VRFITAVCSLQARKPSWGRTDNCSANNSTDKKVGQQHSAERLPPPRHTEISTVSLPQCAITSFPTSLSFFNQSTVSVAKKEHFYFASGRPRSAKYCDQRVCVSVCPLAYLKNHISKFHEIFCTCDHGSVIWCTSGFVDDVMFSHNGAYTVDRRQWSSTIDQSQPACVISSRPHVAASIWQQTVWLSGAAGGVITGRGRSLPSETALNSDLWSWPTYGQVNHRAIYLSQKWFSFKRYCSDTHTYTYTYIGLLKWSVTRAVLSTLFIAIDTYSKDSRKVQEMRLFVKESSIEKRRFAASFRTVCCSVAIRPADAAGLSTACTWDVAHRAITRLLII